MDRHVPLKTATPLHRYVRLESGDKPLVRTSGLPPVSAKRAALLRAGEGKNKSAATTVSRINPVSDKRRAENRERKAMADRRWPDRRDGTVMCSAPECGRPADDLHEILPRGRGGSVTDEANTKPVCRQHNEELTKSPAWGYRAGLLKHDGVCCRGRDVCAQYAEGGEAA